MNWKRLAVTGLACTGLVAFCAYSLIAWQAVVFRRRQKAVSVEARHHLSVLARSATEAFFAQNADGSKYRLCPSASKPVPDLVPDLGRPYQSAPEDWLVDKATNAGFACLQFSMEEPQRYQYSYEATATSFVVRARALVGDGQTKRFEITGKVAGNKVDLSPLVEEAPGGW
jgi:hypothetical protein